MDYVRMVLENSQLFRRERLLVEGTACSIVDEIQALVVQEGHPT